MKTKKLEWKKVGYNSILKMKDFYISYNPNTKNMLGMSSFDGDSNGCSETALCKGNEFFILNGDYRTAYELVIDKGFAVCKKEVFDRFKDNNKSSWSD